jgi:hypothetical protein
MAERRHCGLNKPKALNPGRKILHRGPSMKIRELLTAIPKPYQMTWEDYCSLNENPLPGTNSGTPTGMMRPQPGTNSGTPTGMMRPQPGTDSGTPTQIVRPAFQHGYNPDVDIGANPNMTAGQTFQHGYDPNVDIGANPNMPTPSAGRQPTPRPIMQHGYDSNVDIGANPNMPTPSAGRPQATPPVSPMQHGAAPNIYSEHRSGRRRNRA